MRIASPGETSSMSRDRHPSVLGSMGTHVILLQTVIIKGGNISPALPICMRFSPKHNVRRLSGALFFWAPRRITNRLLHRLHWPCFVCLPPARGCRQRPSKNDKSQILENSFQMCMYRDCGQLRPTPHCEPSLLAPGTPQRRTFLETVQTVTGVRVAMVAQCDFRPAPTARGTS